jgi:hypothetical protein
MVKKANRLETFRLRSSTTTKKNSKDVENRNNKLPQLYLNDDLRPIHQRHYIVERMMCRTYQLACIEYRNRMMIPHGTDPMKEHDADHHHHHEVMIMKIFQRMIYEHYAGWFYRPNEVPNDLVMLPRSAVFTNANKGYDREYRNFYQQFDPMKHHHDDNEQNTSKRNQSKHHDEKKRPDCHQPPQEQDQTNNQQKFNRMALNPRRIPFRLMMLWKSSSSLSSVSSSSSSSSSSASSHDCTPKLKRKNLKSLESTLTSTTTSSETTISSLSSMDCSHVTTTTKLDDDDEIVDTLINEEEKSTNDDNDVIKNEKKDGVPTIAKNGSDEIINEYHTATHDTSNDIHANYTCSSTMNTSIMKTMPPPTTIWTIPYICKEDAEQCCALGYFQTYSYHDLNHEEKNQAEYFFQLMKERTGLVFYPKHNSSMKKQTCHVTEQQQNQQQQQLSLLQQTSSFQTSPSAKKQTNSNHNQMDHHNNVHQEKKNDIIDDETIMYCPPRQLQLEKVTSLHRPLLFYMWIQMIQYVLCTIVLKYIFGFQRIQSKNGLRGWYYSVTKTNKNPSEQQQQQAKRHQIYVFFHGVAPGGLVLYLPMLLFGIFRDHMKNRPKQKRQKNNNANGMDKTATTSIFFFENPNISTTLNAYHALSEEETCQGIYELIHTCLDIPQMKTKKNNNNNVTHQESIRQEKNNANVQLIVVGHSFGTCQVSWMIHSKLFTDWIHTIVLLDPVSILLSDPDVMINFFYRNEHAKKNRYQKFIRLLGSSELFTQCYLRRHFAWYNSELWLEHDIIRNPNQNWNILIALSGNDNIVNATKVKNHIEWVFHSSNQSNDNHTYECIDKNGGNQPGGFNQKKLIYWDNAGHADCVKETRKWDELRHEINRLTKR